MRTPCALLGTVLFVALSGGPVDAVQDISAERGKALFEDPGLGTSGKACSTCHVSGKGLDRAAARTDLDKTINACITGPLRGKAKETASPEMQSLILYIKSVGAKKRLTPPGNLRVN